jgi:biotin carboxylase
VALRLGAQTLGQVPAVGHEQLQLDQVGAVDLLGDRMLDLQARVDLQDEFRINAEDPGRGFLPGGGRIEAIDAPTGPGIRLDSGTSSCSWTRSAP